jgi:DNA-binding MarR family transcriptional regulator
MKNNINRRLDAALQDKWVTRQTILRKLLKETVPLKPEPLGTHPGRDRGFTPEQFVIINILCSYGHGVTVGEIVEGIDIPHANVTRTLDRLEKKGLIHRTRGSKDRRQMIVRLTLEGNKAAGKLAEVEGELDEQLWGGYSDEEKELLLELLNR